MKGLVLTLAVLLTLSGSRQAADMGWPETVEQLVHACGGAESCVGKLSCIGKLKKYYDELVSQRYGFAGRQRSPLEIRKRLQTAKSANFLPRSLVIVGDFATPRTGH